MKRLILIDSHAIIHRAYHALPPLSSPVGEPTHAVYGFTTILLRILQDLKPDYIAACFDLPGPTFRHVAYERYKATRPETPGDLSSQFGKVKEVLEAFGIPVFEKKGYEADDVIGTIACILKGKKDLEIIVVTGDADVLQLVGPRLKVYSMRKGVSDMVIFDEKAVEEKYGFAPVQMVDYKALKGDPSDNIAGVKGIGEKTALQLIKDFKNIEGIYHAAEKGDKKISTSVRERLLAGKEDAFLSRELATIYTEVPIDFSLERAVRNMETGEEIRTVFQKFGFFALIKRLSGPSPAPGQGRKAREADHAPSQPILFFAPAEEVREDKEEITLLDDGKELREKISQWEKEAIGVMEEGGELCVISRQEKRVWRLGPHALGAARVKSFFETHEDMYAYNTKRVIRFLRGFGIELASVAFDAMLAAYLTGVWARDFSYPAVLSRELGRPAAGDPRAEFLHFFEVCDLLSLKVTSEGAGKVFKEIELPVTHILADMEEQGVLVDPAFLKKLAKKIDAELETITAAIYKEAGEEFNINSPRQISHILFDVLGLKTLGLRKTAKGGVISTGAAELEKLKTSHSIVEQILLYRELAKLKGTYVDVLPTLIDSKDGRIHTTFNQTTASTGRLSSSNPNLQHIPISKTNPMSEYGREIRKSFVAPTGFALVSFDYSQIELRVAAHLADDKKMIEAFGRGMDIHKLTAAEIYNVSLEEVTPELRRAAKTLNFGVLYGMGPQALAESTGMSREDARRFIDEYFHDFSGIREYIEKTKRFAEEHGYVETLFGRRRYIPEILSPNWQVKREAERMAVNHPIQGTATGDIIKMAMINVDGWMRKGQLKSDVRMLLQVHDELLFEIKKDVVVSAAPRIKKIMESVAELRVPLVVDAKVGPNWGEQSPVKEE